MALHHSDEPLLPRAVSTGHGLARRALQFMAALTHRHDDALDLRLRAAVQSDGQWRLLLRLSPFDRAHHLAVRDRLERAGHSDPDLLLAAALHDVGKADDAGRVRLAHRVVKVLLERRYPPALERLSEPGHSRLSHGVYLAVNHARLGADLAAKTGASPRCCELIRMHHTLDAAITDSDLQALIRADEGSVT